MDESITFIRQRPSAEQNHFTVYQAPNPLLFSPNNLLHMDGANGSTVFTDATGLHTMTTQGGAHIDTSQFKFGTASGLFSADGDAVTGDSSNDFIFGVGDFTVDCWFKLLGINVFQSLFDFRGNFGSPTNASPHVYITTLNGLHLNNQTAEIIDSGDNVISLDGLWHHAALTRYVGVSRLFLDGYKVGEVADPANYGVGVSNGPIIGAGNNGLGGYSTFLDGWLDEFRVVKGYAAWIASFTPPRSPYTPP